MARVSRPDQEKVEEDPTLAQPQDPAVAQSLGASGGASAPGGRSTEAPAAPAARSHFNDLSRLLYANQGQGRKMAQGAVDKADQGAAGVNSRLADAQNRYTEAAQAGTVKPVAPVTPPPVVSGGGGLTGRGGAPVYQGDLAEFYRQTDAYNNAPKIPRTTTRLNTNTAVDAEAQRTAGSSYQGPHSLAETPGVDIQDMQLGLNRAGQAYSALDRNPSRQTGGVGRFNDFLIGAEGRPVINDAKKRFQGLRDRFVGAVGSAAPTEAAEAETKKNVAEARRILDQGDGARAQAETEQQQRENEDRAARQSEEDYFHEYRLMNPLTPENEARARYEADKDHIKEIIDNNRRSRAGDENAAAEARRGK